MNSRSLLDIICMPWSPIPNSTWILCSMMQSSSCLKQITGNLEVHPELGRILEHTGKKKRRLSSHVPLAIDQGIDPLDRDSHPPRKFNLAHTHRF